jgi:signal peptidase II
MVELIACSGACLALDQWTKQMVVSRIGERGVPLGRVLTLRTAINLAHRDKTARANAALVIVWCAALVSAILLYQSGSWFQSRAAQWGLAAAFGGAAGNLLDMVRRRSVVDFIDLGWWPVFNLADVAIVGGLLLAVSQR